MSLFWCHDGADADVLKDEAQNEMPSEEVRRVVSVEFGVCCVLKPSSHGFEMLHLMRGVSLWVISFRLQLLLNISLCMMSGMRKMKLKSAMDWASVVALVIGRWSASY